MTRTHRPSRPSARSRRSFALAWAITLAALAALGARLWRPHRAAGMPAATPAMQPAAVAEAPPRARTARTGGDAAPGRAQLQRTLRRLIAGLPENASDDRAPTIPPAVQQGLEQLAQDDPRLALRIVGASAPDALTRYALAAVVARAWGAAGPQDAWAWVSTTGAAWNVPEQRSLCAAVWDGMARTAPDFVVATATSVLAAAPAAGERGPENFAREAACALVSAGANEAAQRAVAQWCGWYPGDRFLSGAISVVTASVAAASPAAAQQWLETLAPSPARNDGLAVLAAKWAETAPESAMAWAGSLAHGEGRAAALQGAFTSWACTDLVGCVAWLAQNEADPACDRLIGTLVANPKFRAENPRAAVDLAASIADGTARRGALSSAIQAWAAQDESAARRYLNATHRVSDADKAAILQAMARESEFGYY